jgi:hypothetical protein
MNDRQIQEAVARCVSIAVYYHNSESSKKADATFAEDIRAIADWATEAALDESEADRMILQPLSAELAVRFGDAVGSRLGADFQAAFRKRLVPGPGASLARVPALGV